MCIAFSDRFRSNWDLSAARCEVADYMDNTPIENGCNSYDLRYPTSGVKFNR